jgi:PKD repeat protein
MAAYGLNEGSGPSAADTSGNQNALILKGATWTSAGRNGSALSFNGTGATDAAPSTSLNLTGNALSLEAWVNPSTLAGDTHVVSKLMQAGQHTAPYFSYSLHVVRGNMPRFWVTLGGVPRSVEASVALMPNIWTHLAGTYDGSMLKIYVNGTLAGSAAVSGTITSYAGPLRLAANGSGGEVWTGKIDEVRIYSRALSASDIQADMTTAITPPAAGVPGGEFSGSPTSGPAPLVVQFTDASSGSLTNWSWDFGDGGTSTAQSPTHTYSSPGSYSVKLTVTGPGGAASAVKASYIVVATSATGLVAAYSFDVGSGNTLADASGNGNTGTLKNGPVWATGKYGGSLQFDGVNDYVTIPNSASLDLAGAKLTISFWVNLTDRSGPDMVLLGKPWVAGTMTYPYFQYAVEFDANGDKTLDFYFGDTTDRLRGPFSMKPAVGAWTYAAFTYDGTAVKGYLNGVQQLSAPATQTIKARGNSLLIGVDAGFGQAFEGRLDQVRIYTRALTPGELQADMNSPIQ